MSNARRSGETLWDVASSVHVTRFSRTLPILSGLLAFFLGAADSAGESPHVVASVQPLHALVAGVMEGVGFPDLLVKGNGTPHSYQMRPSEARSLSKADLIFWIGETMELFLTAPLNTLGKDAVIVSALAIRGVHLLPTRAGGVRQRTEKTNRASSGDQPRPQDFSAIDPHIWLSPDNALLIVRNVSDTLGALDPSHAPLYRANAVSMATRIKAMDTAIAQRLAPVAKRPFIVLHDAYQYFEDRYKLTRVGAITIDPDRSPGARRLKEMREIVVRAGAVCVFREPQFDSPLIDTIVEGTVTSIATLDPLGAGFEPGVEAYFRMMDANADALLECLSN